jgi:hypothetical protein
MMGENFKSVADWELDVMSLRLGSLITNQITRIGKLFSVRTMIRERFFTAPDVTTGISRSA